MKHRDRLFYLIAAISTFGMNAAFGQSDAQTKIASVDKLFSEWNMPTSPGCAVAVMKDGRIDYEQGYGIADLDHDVKITPKTIFHVASISKQFTATAVLLLAQEGKLSLDDPVKKYVPEVPDIGAPITLRQLLHHTSGLRDQWELLALAGFRFPEDLVTDGDVLALIARQKALNFEPGSEFLYSNSGFTLLAQVVRRVSGKSLREFTIERLFKPLGMEHTHFRDDHSEIVKGIADGYEGKGDHWQISNTDFDTVGATSLLTTVEDLALWDENFYTARVGGEAVIKKLQERGRLNNGAETDYAAGLEISTYRGLRTVAHSGEDAGYRADMMRFPEQHFSVVTLCNAASARPRLLNVEIADIYLASDLAPVKPPPELAAVFPQPSAEKLKAFAGTYVDRQDGYRVLSLREKVGSLWASPGPEFELKAIDATRFKYVAFPTELDFEGIKGGVPEIVTFHGPNGVKLTFDRVATYTPVTAQLREFSGEFHSDEVNASINVKVGNDRLVLTTLKENFAISPVAPDMFMGPGGARYRFTRDKSGKVNGFTFNSEQTRNFRFDRLLQ